MSAYPMEAPQSAITCPGCGSSHTAPAPTPEQENVLCKTCGTCWYISDGSVERINPEQCPGCALQRICIAAGGLTQ